MSWARRWIDARRSSRLLVIGGASLDRIHVGGDVVATPGGAGLYTALAAARCGIDVTMLAPVPEPMPTELAPVTDLVHWVGPTVDPDDLPRFEIAYDSSGDVSLFREHVGAEPSMDPRLVDHVGDLPGMVYCVPFLDARLQRRFVETVHERGLLTVAATYARAAHDDTDIVRQTFETADLSFCNRAEADILFPTDPNPPTGRLRFVTCGADGVTVLQGDHRTDLAADRTPVVDPTGAGDTFCGTTLARLLLGDHPVEAARRGTAAAARTVSAIGPESLLRPGPPPEVTVPRRVGVDLSVTERMARRLAEFRVPDGFAFTGGSFPDVGDPAAVEWFAVATSQQFGFWYDRDGHWDRPLVSRIGGVDRKGSDYLWALFRRWCDNDPAALEPRRLAHLDDSEWHRIAADDRGRDPFPDSTGRSTMLRDLGRCLAESETTMGELVDAAHRAPSPTLGLITTLDHIAGYREDPYRKKSALLALILRQRPEGLLAVSGVCDDVPPIVDYHVQRACLRTGMITVDDPDLSRRLVDRSTVAADEEAAIRRAAYEAVEVLVETSGRDMGAVDRFLFEMRHRCPESSEPDCARCPADPVCEHRTRLFQPVFRTTAY